MVVPQIVEPGEEFHVNLVGQYQVYLACPLQGPWRAYLLDLPHGPAGKFGVGGIRRRPLAQVGKKVLFVCPDCF